MSLSDPYASFVADASQRFGIPARWIRAVIQVESGGNAKAVSAKGAMGLMQIVPATWAELRLRYHLGADPFDPHDNIFGGTAYLRELYDRFGAGGFLAAYNAGPKCFEEYLSGLRPPRDETKLYLARLAQLLPDVPIDRGLVVAANTPNWRRAVLFAAISPSPQSSVITRPGPPASGASNASAFPLAPQSGGLFAPVANTEPR